MKISKGNVLSVVGLLVGGVGSLIAFIASQAQQREEIENAVQEYLDSKEDDEE